MGDVVISCRLGGSYGGLQHTCSPPGELQSLSELVICYWMVLILSVGVAVSVEVACIDGRRGNFMSFGRVIWRCCVTHLQPSWWAPIIVRARNMLFDGVQHTFSEQQANHLNQCDFFYSIITSSQQHHSTTLVNFFFFNHYEGHYLSPPLLPTDCFLNSILNSILNIVTIKWIIEIFILCFNNLRHFNVSLTEFLD